VAEAIAIIERQVGRRALVERRPAPPGDARDTQAATDRLHALGAIPRVRIDDGLAQQVEWQLRSAARRVFSHAAGHPALHAERGSAPRVLLYSHDTYGLGHLRRNTTIAHGLLRRAPEVEVTLLTGSPVADQWPFPDGVSIVRLPPVTKVGPEDYQPVQARSMSAVRAERAGIIASTLLRVRPDVFLVDHAPLGMKGELRLALEMAREKLPGTRVVLGLRDVLDEPDVVRATWRAQGVYPLMATAYDQVIVYGCRELFDAASEYDIPDAVARRVQYSGYIAKDRDMEHSIDGRETWTQARRAGDRRILVMGGGGGDAAPMLRATIQAWESLRYLLSGEALIVAGPLMAPADRDEVERLASKVAGVQVIGSSTTMLSLVAAADLVVSMGGYNSVVEAVAGRKPLVIWDSPRWPASTAKAMLPRGSPMRWWRRSRPARRRPRRGERSTFGEPSGWQTCCSKWRSTFPWKWRRDGNAFRLPPQALSASVGDLRPERDARIATAGHGAAGLRARGPAGNANPSRSGAASPAGDLSARSEPANSVVVSTDGRRRASGVAGSPGCVADGVGAGDGASLAALAPSRDRRSLARP
jgi:predicted glycosyltransferase